MKEKNKIIDTKIANQRIAVLKLSCYLIWFLKLIQLLYSNNKGLLLEFIKLLIIT